MKVQKPIFWHQGGILQPQHFQLFDRTCQGLFIPYQKFTVPHFWGTGLIKIQKSALGTGSFRIDEGNFLFRDGTYVSIPENALIKPKTQSGFRTKTYKGEGFNELRFDDKAGAEEVFIHAQKDFKTEAVSMASHNAGEQLQLTCGSASIVLYKSGKIVINGTEVTAASGALNLDGVPVKINMGGAAGIAAAPIGLAADAAAKAGGGDTAAAPASAAQKPVFGNYASSTKNPTTGLGKDVDQVAGKSPSLTKNLETFKGKGGKIEYGPNGGGSYYSSSKKLIVIDGAEQNNPTAATQSLAHELGHATDTQKIDESSKEAYVNSKLRGEGQATIANLEARKEILSNGGPDIGVAGSRNSDYKKIYDKYGNRDKSRDAIGKVFGSKETTSTTGVNYSDYYGKAYDN